MEAFLSGSAGLPAFLAQEIVALKPVNPSHKTAAAAHLDNLSKPRGSLGVLEEILLKLAMIQGGAFPLRADPALVITIGADHGVCREGVAAVPQEVTAQQMANFLAGGGAINSFCRSAGLALWLVDAGVAADLPMVPELIQAKIAYGTANMLEGPAMSLEQCLEAFSLGIQLAVRAESAGFYVVGLGEMGIGNTTASSALYCAYLGLDPEETTGLGAGIALERLPHKRAVVERALRLHAGAVASGCPLRIMAALGGLEIAALSGLIIGAAARGLAIMLDGFISGAAYAAALRLAPAVAGYCFFSHASAESGHGPVLRRFQEKPLLDLELRLGEGTGATLGISLLQTAVDAYNTMATFSSAQVHVPD